MPFTELMIPVINQESLHYRCDVRFEPRASLEGPQNRIVIAHEPQTNFRRKFLGSIGIQAIPSRNRRDNAFDDWQML